MSGKGKKIVESEIEGEAEIDDIQNLQDDEVDSMDEDDVNEELGLPKELMTSVTLQEKRELLQYKQTHSELEWENEMMMRIEQLSKKKDMERLKQMTSAGGVEDSSAAAKKPKRKAKATAPVAPVAPSKKYAKGRERKRYQDDDEDVMEDEEGFEDESGSEMDMDDEEETDEDEDEDDLFGDEEYEAISKEQKARPKKQEKSTKATKGKRLRTSKTTKTTTRKRSRLEDYDDSEDDSMEDDDMSDFGEARSEDDEDRRDHQARRKKKRQEEEEEDTSDLAEYMDYLKIQSRRLLLEKWHAEPYFVDVVTGSFVRYCVGHKPGGEATYRMAEVLDVVPTRPYRMSDNKMAERGLRLAVGTSTMEGKMNKVSNHGITEREFKEYVGVLESANEEHLLLRISGLEKRRKKIREASEHTYTHEEVAAMIQKNRMQATKHTANFSHAQSTMKKELEHARAEGDFETMEKVQKEMDKLEREMAESRALYAQKYEKNTTINKRNKDRNIQMDMEAGIRKREMDMKKTKEEKRKDPFARRETRPTILWVTGTKGAVGDEEKSGAESSQAAEEVKEQPEETPPSLEVEETTGDEPSSLEEIAKRIEKKFGFNPHKAALVDKRTRYLESTCRSLPALGTDERSQVRQGISLAQYLQRVSEQMVE
mmetsp:Transcript_11424/g.18601  ORF Transcript_11424/g.18601 Transcript_11424/m.18601 type:complete len:654 (-) Transcript_11424:72-2033(-)